MKEEQALWLIPSRSGDIPVDMLRGMLSVDEQRLLSIIDNRSSVQRLAERVGIAPATLWSRLKRLVALEVLVLHQHPPTPAQAHTAPAPKAAHPGPRVAAPQGRPRYQPSLPPTQPQPQPTSSRQVGVLPRPAYKGPNQSRVSLPEVTQTQTSPYAASELPSLSSLTALARVEQPVSQHDLTDTRGEYPVISQDAMASLLLGEEDLVSEAHLASLPHSLQPRPASAHTPTKNDWLEDDEMDTISYLKNYLLNEASTPQHTTPHPKKKS